MKKLFMAMASLCLIASASSCSTDDLATNEVQSKEINNLKLFPSLENGDRDKDDDTTNDKD